MNKKQNFTFYAVGEKFDRTMDSDGAFLEIEDSLCQCVIGLHDITDEELRAVERGKVVATLSNIEDIIFLSLNFDDVLTFDIPFNMGLYDKFQLKYPGDYGYTMMIFLIDNATNTIKAMRAVGFKNKFSRKLYELSMNQWEHRIEDYDKKLEKILDYTSVSRAELVKNQIACNIFGGGTVEEA